MTVLEKADLYHFWRKHKNCPCNTVFVLRGSWLSRYVRRFVDKNVEFVTGKQMGNGRAIASFLSVKVTEAVLEGWEVDKQVERALLAFFQDKNILLAYRKCLTQWVEDRIAAYQVALQSAKERGCKKVTFVPADIQSLRLLRCWRQVQHDFPPSAIEIVENRLAANLAGLRGYLFSWIVAFGVLAKLLGLLVRQGIVNRPSEPQRFLGALHDRWEVATGRSWGLRSINFLVDGQGIRFEDLLVLTSAEGKDVEHQRQYAEAGIAWASLFGPPLSLEYLLRVLPRLVGAIFKFWAPSGSTHSFLRRRAAGAILYGLRLEIFLHHYNIGVFLSIEEHSYQHIVETVVLNRFGGHTVWIPHTFFTNAGYSTAYIHYNLLPVQGWFPVPIYGSTWSREMAVRSVGTPINDGAEGSDEQLASEKAHRLIRSVRDSYKIVAVFTGSYTPDEFVVERNRRFLKVVADLAERERNLRLIIKPKAGTDWPEHSHFLFEEPFKGIIERGLKDQKIIILDPSQGLTCAAKYLIDAGDIVLSTGQYAAFGSVWIEALLLGKPSYVFAPSEFRLAPFAPEFFDRWIFDDEEALVQVIIADLRRCGSYEVSRRIKYLFDPFNDGGAVERLRDEILRMAKTPGDSGPMEGSRVGVRSN